MLPFPSPWSAARRRNAYICASFHIQNSTTMAKGNMFLGMSRGSVGDVTFYRNRGNQVARARNRTPMNPKSEAQTIQRMILATASKAYSRMKGIVDHSFQGVQYGGVSQSYFLKRAMDDIRTWVSQTITITGEYPTALRSPLVYRGLAYPTNAHQSGVGLLISEGSIPSVQPNIVTPEGSDPVVTGWGGVIGAGTTVTVGDVLRMFNAVPGDQITIVGLRETSAGSFTLLASRYVIKSDASTADLAEPWDGSFDLASMDPKKTQDGGIQLVPYTTAPYNGLNVSLDVVPAGETLGLIASSVIISRKVGESWQRSTQRLVWMLDAGDYSLTDNVAAEWMAGTAPIDTVNPRYLNQAEQSL